MSNVLLEKRNCPHCGQEVAPQAKVCLHCGYALPEDIPGDTPSVGLGILAVLIPLFGLIYYGINYRKLPKRAKKLEYVLLFLLLLR